MNGERHQVAVAFGQALRAARKRCRISQEELAFRAEFDRTYPSLLERGLRTPTLTVYFQICEALDLEADRLLVDTLERMNNPAIEQLPKTP